MQQQNYQDLALNSVDSLDIKQLREWNGKRHTATVQNGFFEYNAKTTKVFPLSPPRLPAHGGTAGYFLA